jgi:O-antigen/teichoic acid export membrane protein
MIVFGVSGVVNRALSILLIPLYTVYIPPREYGALGMMMILLSVAPIILRLGMGNALLRSWYDYKEDERPKLATTVMLFLLSTSIPILAILALFAPQLSNLFFDNDQYTLHLRIICILAFLEVFNVVPDTLLRTRSASLQFAFCQTIGFITQLCVIILLVKYYGMGIKGILIGNLIGSTIENSLMFAFSCRGLSWGINRSELRVMLAFGMPLVFGRLAANVFQFIDRFFLKHYMNLRVVGLYTLGNQLITPISVLVTTPFSMIWANMQFSTMKDSDAKEYYARMLTYVIFASSFFALPLAILVEDILRIFAGIRYWEVSKIVPLLAFAAVLDSANPVLNVGISLKRKNAVNPLIVISSALVNIIFNLILIPPFGMMGATIATVISYITMCMTRYFVSNRLMPIPYEWSRIIKIAVVCFVLFALSRLVQIERPIFSFFARLPFALALPALLLPLGFYDQKELAKAGQLLKSARNFLRPPAVAKISE